MLRVSELTVVSDSVGEMMQALAMFLDGCVDGCMWTWPSLKQSHKQ